MAKYVVAPAADIAPGGRALYEVRGRKIVVFNLGGEYFGLHNRCPHLGGPLCHGSTTGLLQSSMPGSYDYTRRGEMIRCPWHGWEFDIRTGKSWCLPDRIKARRYPVEVEHGGELVEGPYVAETVPVTVEEDYIVVQF